MNENRTWCPAFIRSRRGVRDGKTPCALHLTRSGNHSTNFSVSSVHSVVQPKGVAPGKASGGEGLPQRGEEGVVFVGATDGHAQTIRE